MSNIKTAIAFLLGAAAGGAGAWYFLKEKYAEQSEQDIASAKEAFHNREEKLQAEITELKKQLPPDIEENVPPTVLVNEKTPDKDGDPVEYARGKYQMYNPAPIARDGAQPAPQPEPGPKADGIEAPYVISPEEFGEVGYTQVSLTYYADGILADENGEIVDDIEEIVGDALEHFGEYEDDSVYCRSDPKKCDYEILQDLRRYADVAKNLPPNR